MSKTLQTPRERQIAKRYVTQIIALMTSYIVILLISIHVLQTANLSPLWRDLLAITLALPLFGVVAAVIRFLGSVDELQRQVHIEALAIAAGVTAALAITYTFLEGVGFPHSEAWWAFVSINVFWMISLPFVQRRYR